MSSSFCDICIDIDLILTRERELEERLKWKRLEMFNIHREYEMMVQEQQYLKELKAQIHLNECETILECNEKMKKKIAIRKAVDQQEVVMRHE